jgi:hypothetical protein
MAMIGAERQARKTPRLKAQARAARKASDKETPPLSESERRVIAFHEAGHAVIAWQLGLCIKTVSIVPAEGWQGHTVYHKSPLRGSNLDYSDRGHRRTEKMIEVALAGPAAQVIAAPNSWSPEQGHSGAHAPARTAGMLSSECCDSCGHHRQPHQRESLD